MLHKRKLFRSLYLLINRIICQMNIFTDINVIILTVFFNSYRNNFCTAANGHFSRTGIQWHDNLILNNIPGAFRIYQQTAPLL